MNRIFNSIEKLPKLYIFSISIIVTIILGFLDYISGQEFTFYIFYIIPVLFVVWFAGKKYGLILSFACLLSLYVDNFLGRTIVISVSLIIWNIFIQVSFFVILVLLISYLKQILEKEKELEKQKFKRELEIAGEVQRKLFPQTEPEIDGIEYCGVCIPAEEVGGDYYDYFKIKENEIALVIGDIAGHGLPSALLMAGLVGFVRSNAVQYNYDLKVLLEKINALMCNSTDGSRFATFFYSTYNSSEKILRFVNAGHNPPLLYSADTRIFSELKTNNFIIGAISSMKYNDSSVKLKSGDLLIYYTDGITEMFNSKDELFGEERLKEVVEKNSNCSPKEISDKIIWEVKAYAGEKEQMDDMTLLIIKLK